MILLWEIFLPEGGKSHVAHLEALTIGLVIDQIKYYLVLTSVFWSGIPGAEILYGATIPLAIVGMYRRWPSDYNIFLYGLLTILTLIFWPYKQGLRFLFPLLPFYFSFVLTGLEKCEFYYSRNLLVRMICIFPVIIVIILFLSISTIRSYENAIHHRINNIGPYSIASKEVFTFINQNIDKSSIILFRKPRVMRLFTGKRSLLIDQVDKLTKGDYLCISLTPTYHQIGNKDLESLREKGKIKLIFINKEFEVYKIEDSIKF